MEPTRTKSRWWWGVAIAAWAASCPAAAQPGDPPEASEVRWHVPSLHFVAGVVGTGEDVWIAASNEGLLRLGPNRTPERVTGPRSAIAIARSSTGAVYVADRDRTIHRMEEGRWTRGPTAPEGGFGDDITALAVGPSGTVYALAETGGLHVWDGRGRRLTTVRLPGEGEAQHLAVAGDRAYVTGENRRIHEVRGRRVRTPAWAAAALAALDRDYQELGALWVSPVSGHLWIGTSARRLLEVDLQTNRVTVHDVGLFGLGRAITGTVVDGAEVVIVGFQSEMATLTNGQVEQLPGEAVFPSGMYVHPGTGTLVISCQDGVHLLSLPERRVITPIEAQIVTRPTESATSSAAEEGRAPPPSGGGLSFEDVQLDGDCGFFGSVALIAQAQSRAAQCVPAGSSVAVTLQVRGQRATHVEAEPGRPAACVRRRLANLPVPGANRCEVRFRMVH